MENKVERTYRAWRLAAEKGYGNRCNTLVAMERVDARIRRLKEAYEAAVRSARTSLTLVGEG